MSARAASVSKWREYMRYAATIAALRPEGAMRNGIGRIGSGSYRTHSRLTVDKNAMALVELGLNERDTCDEVVQDVLFLGVVDFYVFVGEGLLGTSGYGI